MAKNLKKTTYTPEKAAEILKEAEMYHIIYSGQSQEWYEDKPSSHGYEKAIEPNTILVKNDKFYGCVLVCRYSSWGYHSTNDGEDLTALTLDKLTALVENIDHSTQNGDSHYYTEAFLEKIEQ